MSRWLYFIYGLVAYAAFFATILYAIGFVGGWVVPKALDDGVETPRGRAIFINVLLLAAFAVQHTIMARPEFKARWTKLVPKPIERSTFVLAASLLVALMMWQWRPMPEVVWHFEHPGARAFLAALSLIGWALVFYSSFVIDHFDLFGLRQIYLHLKGQPYVHPAFAERSLYKLVRHPLMAGFLIAFWSTPDMTEGHLLFALVTTAYILFGIAVEERDLARILGDDYRRYRERTPMLLPWPKRGQTP